ncbi:TPA: hypothetical protein ACTW83_004117 [Klebsiella michiganensis]
MNISTVNELIQSLESAGELSIKERKYLDVMRWAIRVAGERDAALNAERVWEKTMMEVCGEDGPASVASEIRSLRALRDTAIQALKSQVEQLAAENVALAAENKMAVDAVTVFSNVTHDITDIICDELGHDRVAEIVAAYNDLGNMPATDRIVAGIKADGVEEFAAYQRSLSSGWASDKGPFSCLKSAEDAEGFAQKLREGADK